MSTTTIEKLEQLTKKRYDMPRTSAGDLSLKDRLQCMKKFASVDEDSTNKKFDHLTKKRFDGMPRMSAGDKSLKDRISLYNERATNAEKNLEKNPFSDTYKQQHHDINDESYGRPEAGSLTERRGIAAGE